MHSSLFFKLFPPPRFLLMKHGGLDISDDAIHFLEYDSTVHGATIGKYACVELPAGCVEDGDIKDGKKLGDALEKLDRAQGITFAKVSLPEEKVYLFQTDVQSTDVKGIVQNIESKLEENVPLGPLAGAANVTATPASGVVIAQPFVLVRVT